MESDADSAVPRSEFLRHLADLSHDLKTPLTSLKMSIHLLQEDASAALTPAQRDLLGAAADEVERLQQLIVEHLDRPRGFPAGR
jgi:K+-sensing histidine kinase KdpD